MYSSMMPMMMGPIMPLMPVMAGMGAAESTTEEKRAELESQKQQITRFMEAGKMALGQIEEELAALEVDADDKEAVARQRQATVVADANALRRTAATDLQTQNYVQQAQQYLQDRARLNYLNDRRQWVAGGEEFGRPIL
jgi:ArsR family metal-binding transcriptional regulator